MSAPFLAGEQPKVDHLVSTTPPSTERQKDLRGLSSNQLETINTRGMKLISETLKRLCKMINSHLSPQAIIEYSNRLTTRLSTCHDICDYIEVIAQVTEDLESIQSLIQNCSPDVVSQNKMVGSPDPNRQQKTRNGLEKLIRQNNSETKLVQHLSQIGSSVQTYRLRSKVGSPEISRVDKTQLIVSGVAHSRQNIPKHMENFGYPKGKESQKAPPQFSLKEPPQVTPSVEPARHLRKQLSAIDLLQRQSSAKSLDFKQVEKRLHSSSSQLLGLQKEATKPVSTTNKEANQKKVSKPKKLKTNLLMGCYSPNLQHKVVTSPSGARDDQADEKSKTRKFPFANPNLPAQFQHGEMKCLQFIWNPSVGVAD